MRSDLSADQELFRETTSRFLDEFVSPAQLRSLRDDPVGFDLTHWRRGVELGWTSLLVAESFGGGSISEHGLVDLTLVAHEFGMHAASGPLVSANVVAATLSDAGSHRDVLEGLLSGAAMATWCHATPSVDIVIAGTDIILSGVLRPVQSANVADYLLVTGRTDAGLSQVLVPRELAGACSLNQASWRT